MYIPDWKIEQDNQIKMQKNWFKSPKKSKWDDYPPEERERYEEYND